MKNIKNFTLFSMLSVMILFASCAPESKGYISAVPKNPVFALKVNVGSLLDESQILHDDLVNNFLRQFINELPRELRGVMRDILDEPSNSGIDVDKPALLVLEGLAPARAQVCLAIKDKEKLAEIFKLTFNELGGGGMALSTEDGCYIVADKQNVYLAFDDSKLVFAVSDGVADAQEYMKLSESALDNDYFCKFVDNNDDAGLYMDYDQFVRLAKFANGAEFAQAMSVYAGMIQCISLNFEDGRIVMKISTEGNTELLEKNQEMSKTPSGRFLKYVPKNAYGVAQFGLRNLSKIFESLDDKTRAEINEIIEVSGFDVKLLDDIDGDVLFAVLPKADTGGSIVPQMLCFVESEKGIFDYMVNMLKAENKNLTAVGSDVYALGVNRVIDWANSHFNYNYNTYEYEYVYKRSGYDYYIGYVDGCIFAMPENIYKKCVDDDELVALRKNYTDSPMAAYLDKNIALVCGFDEIAADWQNEPMLVKMLNFFESVRIVSPSITDGEIVVELTNKGVNALKQIVDMIEDVIGLYM